MNGDIKMEIENYVLQELEYLKNLDKQNEEHEKVVNSSINAIKTLVEILQKEDVNEDNLDLENKKMRYAEIKNDSDKELKIKELKLNSQRDIELRSDRLAKLLMDGATIVVPIIFYNIWMNKGFKFEETGIYTSNTFKNLFNKFKPCK